MVGSDDGPDPSEMVDEAWRAELNTAFIKTGCQRQDLTTERGVIKTLRAALAECRRHAPQPQKLIAAKGAASAPQEALMRVPGPLFIEGRSGTGKTTVICGRIALHHQNKGHSLLFVTRSSILRDEVRRIVQAAGVQCRTPHELSDYSSYPLLSTWDELLGFISSRCKEKRRLPKSMTFEMFQKMQLRGVSSLGPHLVWAEFLSRLQSGRIKSCAEYVSASAGFSVTGIRMLHEDFQHIFAAFKEYQAYKKRHVLADDADIAEHFIAMLASQSMNVKFDAVLVDEVQDFTPAQCRLLLRICNMPQGICFAGDTAQTITNGCGFTFDDLRMMCKHEFYQVEPPPTAHLGTNYRSPHEIVELARAEIRLVGACFPGTVSPIQEGLHIKSHGDKPLFIMATTNLVNLIHGQLNELDASHFLVVVRSNDKRESLRSLGLNATILTVAEAKGLERDVVLVIDFFNDCPLPHAGLLWNFPRAALSVGAGHAMTSDGEDRVAWLLKTQQDSTVLRNLSKKERREVYAFAPAALEVKHLYVADTRSCGQLVHVESNERLSTHLLRYLAQEGNLMDVKDPASLGPGGVTGHPSVVKHVFSRGGPCLKHALDVATKSLELYSHASDDPSRHAVYGEAARTFSKSYDEVAALCSATVPAATFNKDDGELLLRALRAAKHLSSGHFSRKYIRDCQTAAESYLEARILELAGEAFAEVGTYEMAASCFMYVNHRLAAQHLQQAGFYGRSITVLLCGEGSEAALSEAVMNFRATDLDRSADDKLFLAAVLQALLTDEGVDWLVASNDSSKILVLWFSEVLKDAGLMEWSRLLFERMPAFASDAFGKAVTPYAQGGGLQSYLVESLQDFANVVAPKELITGLFSHDRTPPVDCLVIAANMLLRDDDFGNVSAIATLSVLEAKARSKLQGLTGSALMTQVTNVLAWARSQLPDLSGSYTRACRANKDSWWPLASIVAFMKPDQICRWIASDPPVAAESWENASSDEIIFVDAALQRLQLVQDKLLEALVQLRQQLKLYSDSYAYLNSLGCKLARWMEDLRRNRKYIGDSWVEAEYPQVETPLSPGALPLSSRVKGLLTNDDGSTFKCYRFTVSKLRGGEKEQVLHLGALTFYRQSKPLDMRCAQAFVPNGRSPIGNEPSKAIDGFPGTQWVEKNYSSPLIIEFPEPITVDAYSFRTAQDDPSHDPVSWVLEGLRNAHDSHGIKLNATTDDEYSTMRNFEYWRLPVTDKELHHEMSDLVGSPPDLPHALKAEPEFQSWLEGSVVPEIHKTVSAVCCLLPWAAELNKEIDSASIRQDLSEFYQSKLYLLPECHSGVVNAVIEAMTFGVEFRPSSRFHTHAVVPILNTQLHMCLSNSHRCTATLQQMQQFASLCLSWPSV